MSNIAELYKMVSRLLGGNFVVQYNKGPRDWQDLFGITRFCHIESLFHIFHYQWGNMKFSVILRTSLYRGSLN